MLAALDALPLNTLFARAVVLDEAAGRVLVGPDAANATYVVHDYGMSLLFGADLDDATLAYVLTRDRARDEWLQVAPTRAAARFARLEPPQAREQHTRVNFAFSPMLFHTRRRALAASPKIEPVSESTFAVAGSVVPQAFWRDSRRFLELGTGFAVLVEGEVASIAFSAFVTATQLEIGIETAAPFRGRGLAAFACVALIDHCLARGLEPVWSCRLENTASHRLATSLGFTPTRALPCFRLPARVGAQATQLT
ncbi:MAG: GNAT family N-acetyltransferase [Deltaproteobacteria bacterium]|nr:GNAT family N-acetyltransferase [Deltaproteobacteria bacterium]